jgi:hypothetical protein
MSKPQILIDADRVVLSCFSGMAVPTLVEIPDDKVVEDDSFYVYSLDGSKRYIVSEKVLKFNRKALKKISKCKIEKADPRYKGGDDTMIIPVGKPGSAERKEALAQQYAAIMASGEEISPFSWRGDD